VTLADVPTTTTTTLAPQVLGEVLVAPAPIAELPRTGAFSRRLLDVEEAGVSPFAGGRATPFLSSVFRW
jgi:hypothetical protein